MENVKVELEFFKENEFACPCCGLVGTTERTMLAVDQLRAMVGFAISISSATRCPSHNQIVGGSKYSDHLSTNIFGCTGLDIFCVDSIQRFKIISAAISLGFKKIGIYESHVHLSLPLSRNDGIVYYGIYKK